MEKVHKKIIFIPFFFFKFFPAYAPRARKKITTYLFLGNFPLKVPPPPPQKKKSAIKITTKNDEKSSVKGKFFFLIFYNFIQIFLLPYSQKTIPLTFPPLLSTEMGKPHGKTSRKKFLFRFFVSNFSTLRSSCSKEITTHLFLRTSDLMCPKIPLGSKKFLFVQIFFFFNFLHIFSLPLPQRKIPLPFSLFLTGNRKNRT